MLQCDHGMPQPEVRDARERETRPSSQARSAAQGCASLAIERDARRPAILHRHGEPRGWPKFRGCSSACRSSRWRRSLRPVRSWWERDGRSAKIRGGAPEVATYRSRRRPTTRPCFPSECRRSSVSWLVPRREGLLARSAGVGLGVLSEMLEAEVEEVVGPKR